MVKSEARAAQKNQRSKVNAITEKPLTLVYEEKEEVQIHPNQSEATTFIAADLQSAKKAELVACFRLNYDVFAWSTHELPGISPSIDRNMEVYVDDILIKPLQAVDLCAAIGETCQTLMAYGIKLNPRKCLFGAKSD
ncbi:uncharacterized protein LOC122050525 [Zingiber officinale]|uniref:uncharacterized protein LOC122050525 n=1 Tax=Zingiber officinale TaxID=94328 RepID=UPI001C4BF184|nr:uncharacterized protein LOC122050525 [Zingiber officinale]